MSLVDADLNFFPRLPGLMASGSAAGFTFDAIATNSDQIQLIFAAPKTGTLANIHYRISAVTSPVMTHRIELRTVDMATGLANAAGTLYGSSTSITKDASTYAANTNYTAAVAASMTAGDIVAAVFDLSAFTSGSFAQVDRVSEVLAGSSSGIGAGFPYKVTGNSPSAPAVATAIMNALALEYSGGVFVPIAGNYQWVGSVSSAAVTTSGTTRRGNIFRPQTPRRAIGIYANCAYGAGVSLFRLRLASDDSILATCTPDKDVKNAATGNYKFFMFDSGATVSLTAGTDYYITIEGADATGATIYFLQNAPSNAMLDIMPGGKNCHGYTYAGSWSAANTTRYDLGLITDQEDNGAGGGGGLLTHPGMAGGMRG